MSARWGLGGGVPGESDLLQTQKSYRDANKKERGGGGGNPIFFAPDFCSGERDIPVAEGH